MAPPFENRTQLLTEVVVARNENTYVCGKENADLNRLRLVFAPDTESNNIHKHNFFEDEYDDEDDYRIGVSGFKSGACTIKESA